MIDSPRSLSFQIVKDYLILDNLTKTEKLFDFPLSQFVFLLALLNFLTLSRASEVTRERVSKVETNKNKSWDLLRKSLNKREENCQSIQKSWNSRFYFSDSILFLFNFFQQNQSLKYIYFQPNRAYLFTTKMDNMLLQISFHPWVLALDNFSTFCQKYYEFHKILDLIFGICFKYTIYSYRRWICMDSRGFEIFLNLDQSQKLKVKKLNPTN